MSSTPVAERTRICQLERELRRTRLLGVFGILVGAAVALSGFQRTAPEAVRAERFELVSKQGVRRAILRADTLGFLVTLVDERGQSAGFLRLSEEPRVAVETGRGREVAGLGAPKVHNLR
jgi:hypothetical protein